MFLRRSRFRFYSIAVPLVAAVVVWGIYRMRPLATLELADGSVLELREVTYERELRFKSPPPKGTTLWQRIKYRFKGPNYSHRVDGPGPAFIFTLNSRKPDESPARIEAFRAFFDGDRPIEQNAGRTGSIAYWPNAVFPRREKTFRAQVKIEGVWRDWVLPNPFHGQPVPTWTPEEFPIKRVFGELEYTAVGWRPGNFGPYLKFELHYRGKRVAWPVVSASSKIYCDPTGNESNEMLSFAERAWKVRHSVTTGMQAPLGPDHKVSLAKMKVPETGERGMKEIGGFPDPGRTIYFGYTGGGAFRFVNGGPVEEDERTTAAITRSTANFQSVLHAATSPDGKGWSVFGTTEGPAFLFISKSATGKRHPRIEDGYTAGGKWKDFRLLNHTSDESGLIDAKTLQAAEPVGTELNVDLFWHEKFEVELMIPPPPPELGQPRSPR